MTAADRAARHRALGDEHRLAIVDALWSSDRTPSELSRATSLPTNLLAFHLGVLEDAGLVSRHRSQGDGRRRYVRLADDVPTWVGEPAPITAGTVLFVCTRNAARSQLAASLWTRRTGRPAVSAGAAPADAVDATARAVARELGLSLDDVPRQYHDVTAEVDLIVSVCDRAREGGLPFDVPLLHWSIPDPAPGDRGAMVTTSAAIDRRVDRLARQVAA